MTDSEAIHPGYGFLSENAHFAEVCRDCEIEFIGPTPEAMGRLGDKISCKRLAKEAGTPVFPGTDGEIEELDEAIEIANDTDYGLTNYIQTQDHKKVQRVARKLRSGMVDVNGAGIAVDAPFGGYKHSGIGREAGKEGLIEFLEVKSVGGWS